MAPRMLVTGGAGFIGGAVVTAALAAGWQVRVLDSLRPDVHASDSYDAVMETPGAELVVGDVGDRRVVDRCLHEVDVVCHQAAKVGLGVDISDAPDYVASNSLATAVLLAAMRDAQVGRLVMASSMVVYGEGLYRDGDRLVAAPPRAREALEAGRFEPTSSSGEPLEPALIDEDRACDPRNVYAATKYEQELLARDWARSTGGRAALLRYHNVYGPRMPQGTPYAGVASLFRSALERGEAPRVFEDGRQRRDFVHVRDVAGANLAAADWTAGVDAGTVRAFNVASGEVHTIGEFAAALAQAMGGPAPVVTGEFRMGDVRHITASSARIRAELGWRPQVPFDAGVREFASAALRPPAGRP
ncbi:NAD-dependent epimerase/dehydratase family protein [Microbacterium bovistercoris]|uniref:NAD-dependent epimerase/dehydratase family protein n=1 Tax=Microbacterium bovistercoris TaxID=2293570 RepID=A0A371NNZ4_9MICO|nr:NAD-dependent epimerase/dehydratase family protein [Microbacterium bovistercoris]REJ03912.1 NAD-dependent epimerase/dehydratase family protein [Microbacterium bovistercoris]